MIENLLGGPEPTLLPVDPAAADLAAGSPVADVVRRWPTSSLVWATLAAAALVDGRDVEGYAYARVGYHRGLDQLRRSGWKGHGPVPWEHAPNRGFLRALHSLSVAAGRIGETEEAARCADFLSDSSPTAAAELRV
jgi:hypothetical protein